MKRKLLTTLLTLPIVSTTLPIVVACNNQTSNKKEASPLAVKTKHTVTFQAHQGEEVTFVGSTTVKADDGSFFATVVTPGAYNKAGYPVSYWEDENHTKITSKTIISKDLTLYPVFDDIEIQNCIGLTAIQDSTISIENHGNSNPDIKYSLDGRTWEKYGSSFITLQSGQSVYFRGDNDEGFSKSTSDYTSFSIGGAVSLIGNVMTLIDDGKGTTKNIPSGYCFYRLFEGCSGIVSISSNLLPADHLTEYCYAFMFSDCTNLTDFPSSLLPAKVLCWDDVYNGAMCYAGMFSNCTGITNIPPNLLEAQYLSTYCYYAMFENCTGLTSLDSGVLSATLNSATDTGCYSNMFQNCTNLKTIADDALPSLALAPSCYYSMFSNCTSLDDLSNLKLPAETLESQCYGEMFYNCTGLTKAPQMFGTRLKASCYYSMFYNCTKLTQVDPFPNDGNVALAANCCEYMFGNCSSLTAMPPMPDLDTQLQPQCFDHMFSKCTGITDISGTLQYENLASYCYQYMFIGCSGIKTVMESLPSEQLFTGCYLGMFDGCIEMTVAPMLPATTPKYECYAAMFYGCKKLKQASIGLTSFTDDGLDCMFLMFSNCQTLYIQYEQPGQGGICVTIPQYTGTKGYTSADFCSGMFINTANPQDGFIYTPNYGQVCYYRTA